MLQYVADGFVCKPVHSRWFNMRKERLSGRTIKGSHCTCVIQHLTPSSNVILRTKLSDTLRNEMVSKGWNQTEEWGA